MIVALALAGLIAAASPVPTAKPTVLKEIGRGGNAAGVCGSLVVHANSAISAALRDDTLVSRAIARLRGTDLENNLAARATGIRELGLLGSDLYEESAHGDSELKRLRGLSDKSKDEGRKAEVRIFVEALGKAFAVHNRIAVDLNDFLAYLDYRDLRENPLSDAPRNGALDPFAKNPYARPTPTPSPSLFGRSGSPNKMALAAASEFEGRINRARSDESLAADHSESAVSGCSS
ncbi:MAG: hypothetical protein GIW95_10975 [Candidatus Eremiobacteraeota bacterium]|nr:hypothetical protein [Candidatus Eremiobacteraeota bacterium]